MSTECPSCRKELSQPRPAHCPYCGWRFEPKAGAPVLTKPAPRPKLPVDLVLAVDIDRTGSSSRFQEGIDRSLEQILPALEHKVASVKGFLWSHGDLDEGQQPVLLTDGAGAGQMLADAKTIVYDGGGDPPEHHCDAVENLLQNVPWAAQTRAGRGAIIGFMTAYSKPARSGRSAREIGEKVARKGILFYLICEPTPTLAELCEAAGGLMFRISNDPEPEQMQAIAAQVGASIVASVTAGSTVPLSVSEGG